MVGHVGWKFGTERIGRKASPKGRSYFRGYRLRVLFLLWGGLVEQGGAR